jgi:uncharacterized protein
MNAPESARYLDTVPSPCISICTMNPRTGLCAGCLRTLDEIVGWSRFDKPGKLAVLARIDVRRNSPQGGAGTIA